MRLLHGLIVVTCDPQCLTEHMHDLSFALHGKCAPSNRGGSPIQTGRHCQGSSGGTPGHPPCPLPWLLAPRRAQAHDVLFPDLLEALEITEGELQDMDVMRNGYFGHFYQYTLIEST